MSYYAELVENIPKYVSGMFNLYPFNNLLYHNLEHTKSVVKRTNEIAGSFSLSDTDVFIISASAWFHDVGHLVGSVQLHEDRSVRMMKRFFEGYTVPKSVVDNIETCICATKFPARPKTLLEEIICDADTYNLGTHDFVTTDKLLKQELQLRNIAVDNWEEKTLELLLNHRYFTPYCQARLNQGKQDNILFVRNLLQIR